MKKLLLILLCLPMIGFGQNKMKSSEYDTSKDYELLLSENSPHITLRSLVERLENDGFELMTFDGKIFKYSNKYGYPTLVFKKRYVIKYIDVYVDDPENLGIWRVSTQIVKMKKTFGPSLKTFRDEFNKFQDKILVDENYKLSGSKTLYEYKMKWCKIKNIPFLDAKIYTNISGQCNSNTDSFTEELIKQCQILHYYGSNTGKGCDPDGNDWIFMYTVVENVQASEDLEMLESIAARLDNDGNIKTSTSSSKISIPIIKEGNMNFISIKIGGKSYKYLIDTGAFTMTMNTEMKDYLMQAGILSSSDFGQSGFATIANGQKVSYKSATLNSIEISGNKFTDIPISISDNFSLLLGMSFLDKFHWRINNDVLELERK